MNDDNHNRARFLSYGRQSISEDDIAAVTRVLRSDWLTQGPAVPEFERAMRERVGARHAVAVSSATAALHIVCIALGLGPGKRLWTSPNTFVASANCARYCGAEVDFVDIDPDTLNMSVPELTVKLEGAQRDGKLPNVVVPVHFGGLPCDMAAIAALAKRYGFSVLEDASHAVGAEYRGDRIGSCRHSDAAVFSFHPVKVMTTGEGGMILTNAKSLWEKVCLLRSHGTTRDPGQLVSETHGSWYYQQILLGYNYRMTDIQAALGTAQLGRLDDFLVRRNLLARRYDSLLSGLAVRTQTEPAYARSSHHLYPVRLVSPKIDRRQVFDRLRSAGIGVNVHYIPVHTQPYYNALGFKHGDFPEAEKYYAEALSLPLHYELTENDQDYVVNELARALAGRSGVA
jgi:UDP-4-amino-4,6-dideoxy-N-acetyl-beta-L-altrosamine transaminase